MGCVRIDATVAAGTRVYSPVQGIDLSVNARRS